MAIKKKSLSKILLIATLFVFGFHIYQNRSLYLTKYNYAYYSDRYLNSQYVKSQAATYIIDDYDLYAFSGYYYISGGEVARVNFENPPFAKYLIGLSIVLFKNQLVVYLFYGLAYLWITYQLGKTIFKDDLIAALSSLLLTLDPYFNRSITAPLLDFPAGLFFLIGLYFFLKAKNWRMHALSAVSFGLLIASKFFPYFFFIIIYLGLYQFIERRKTFLPFLLTLPLTGLTYLLSYSQYLTQHSFWEFIRYQWWIIRWRMGNPIVLGNGFRVIFSGKFKPWWESTEVLHQYTAEWTIILPIIVSLAILSIFLFWKNKLFRLVYGLIVIFFLYYNLLTEGGLKYLAPYYALFSIFSVALIDWMIRQFLQRSRSNLISK